MRPVARCRWVTRTLQLPILGTNVTDSRSGQGNRVAWADQVHASQRTRPDPPPAARYTGARGRPLSMDAGHRCRGWFARPDGRRPCGHCRRRQDQHGPVAGLQRPPCIPVMLHASARRSLVAGEPLWAETAQGADKIASMLHRQPTRSRRRRRTTHRSRPLSRASEKPLLRVRSALQDAIASSKANGHLVVAEADVVGLSSGGSFIGVAVDEPILCPSPGVARTLPASPCPALLGEAVPGRGYFVQSGGSGKCRCPEYDKTRWGLVPIAHDKTE